eukprot:UN27086
MTLKNAIKGAVVAELIFDPLALIPSYYITTDLVKGLTWDESVTHLRNEFLLTWGSSVCTWFPSTVINLYFVPLHLRVTYDCGITLIWAVILSFISNRNLKPKATVATSLAE